MTPARGCRSNVPLVASAVFLALFGILMQYCASSYTAQLQTGDAFFFVKKQAVAAVAAFIVMFALSRTDTAVLRKFSVVFLALSVAALALVFVPRVGVEKYGAVRWINLGFATVQPSEFAKFALVLFMADRMADRNRGAAFNALAVAAAAAAVCALVMLEPNMSVTVCIAAAVMILAFLGGLKLRYFAALAVPAAAAAAVLIAAEPYRMKRLLAFLDPWASPLSEGYQLIQSYYALGSGGWFGLGLFNSRQKYLFLPFAESDFVFSVVGEELGLLGCIFVMGIFTVLIVSGTVTAMRAERRFDAFLCAGIMCVTAVQTLLNIAVVTGCVPPTGLPMPFLSSGGSSLLVFMGAVGVVDSVARSQSSLPRHKMY